MQEESDALRVLAAAERLFNDRGIQAVGMDAIRDAAGLPLKRLYHHFPSKADLVRAVLEHRDCEVREAIAQFVDARARTPRERVLAVFDFLFEWFAQTGFRGCLFINTVGELGGTVDDVGRIARQHKLAVREYLADLIADCPVPEALADQLLILANGAMVTAAMHDDPQAARRARDAAETLLSAAERRGG
ncbi:TetR/AcrR family transcriptional regulator [Nocardia gipuzkoensis]|uniref:TetR/AcrR family transcriptional regulator n=1 Tax=Nocardia gipuzkoensis TaxID=2749991 RepID=UPI001E50743A|nr:TetR/AcrR family transcriptional regulator [Nocardia gipuzkoensis]UGT71307.1 TetR/AcrR family transcriptional regulator [Nocardia gipuzkoensis]